MTANQLAAERLRDAASIAWDTRWAIGKDPNGDGLTTIGDVLHILVWAFFAPGDWLLLMLMCHTPMLAHFLEISVSDLYGVLSGFVSGLVWLFVLLVSSIASEASNRPTY